MKMKTKSKLFTTVLLAITLIMITNCAGLGGSSGVSSGRRGSGNASQDGPTAEEWNIPLPEPPGMIRIQGGTFMMGSPQSESGRGNDEAQHEVTVSSFLMGRYPVTVKEFREVMGYNPSYYWEGGSWGVTGEGLPVDYHDIYLPVTFLSWFDALVYCNKLSEKERLTPVYTFTGLKQHESSGSYLGLGATANWNANGYRLPTEAEWEYACRAGTTSAYYTGDSWTDDIGWYRDNTEGHKPNDTQHPMPVGRKTPNPWGLYDMHGNVDEWCWDWKMPYPDGPQTNPRGPASGDYENDDKVIRGGSIQALRTELRSADRGPSNWGTPNSASYRYGFRVVRNSN